MIAKLGFSFKWEPLSLIQLEASKYFLPGSQGSDNDLKGGLCILRLYSDKSYSDKLLIASANQLGNSNSDNHVIRFHRLRSSLLVALLFALSV
jgi:hypothetical protein